MNYKIELNYSQILDLKYLLKNKIRKSEKEEINKEELENYKKILIQLEAL